MRMGAVQQPQSWLRVGGQGRREQGCGRVQSMRVSRGKGFSFLLGPPCSGLVEGGSSDDPGEMEEGKVSVGG